MGKGGVEGSSVDPELVHHAGVERGRKVGGAPGAAWYFTGKAQRGTGRHHGDVSLK